MDYSHGKKTTPLWCFALIIVSGIVLRPSPVLGKRSLTMSMNVIDKCWRWNIQWFEQRDQLASCSVGYAGKMTNNTGPGLTYYVVTDPSDDDPMNPIPGTLRYGVTSIPGKVWITFRNNMRIRLKGPLLVGSFTAIDGRGANVHIAGGACLMLQRVNNVILHSLRIHHCQAQAPGQVMGPERNIVKLGHVDGDGIRMLTSYKVWIDHNTLYDCEDGLIDVTRGSTDITITNNWFRYQNKVMLLGHNDGFKRDKNMKVTVAFNYFGPGCVQRMPRVRYGYAHVVNNLYQGWGIYAIGGSMNPSIKSQANLFIAPPGKKEVTWIKNKGQGMSWNFHSVDDIFENGASFDQSGNSVKKPKYNDEEVFPVANATSVRALTRSSGVLRCSKRSRC